MRRVLVISYLFPPMGGVGVQRTLKFVKYLRDFGWEPFVLAARPPRHGLRDESLLADLPQGVSVTRTRAIIPPQSLPWRVRDFITRWILTIDEQVGWLPFAQRAGLEIIRDHHIDLVYSTSTPYTAHCVARYLHAQTRLPWVADFRDPWVGNANLHFATPFHRKFVESKERQVIQQADHIQVVSPPMAEAFTSRYDGLSASRLTCLPNGFDAQDFAHIQPAARAQDRFTLVYTGSFYAHGRTARSFLEAISSALQHGAIPRQALDIQLVGNLGNATLEWITELGLNDIVQTPGFIPHDQSLARLFSADVLLLIVGDAADSAGVYTGKLFEYLAAQKPILCLANGGVAADLVLKSRTGRVVPPEAVDQIKENLVEMYQAWKEGLLQIQPNQPLIQSFERKQLTERLAVIFDGLINQGVA